MEESVDSLNLLPRVKPYVDNFVAGIRQDGIEHLFKLHTPSIGDKNGMNNKVSNIIYHWIWAAPCPDLMVNYNTDFRVVIYHQNLATARNGW